MVHLLGGCRSHASLHRHCSLRLRTSPPTYPSHGIYQEGSLPRLPTSVVPVPPPAAFYRCIHLVHLPVEASTTPLTLARPHRPRSSPTSAPSWCIFQEGPHRAYLHRRCPDRHRPSPICASIWCNSRRYPCHAPLPLQHPHRPPVVYLPALSVCVTPGGAHATPLYISNAHTTSGRLLPVNLIGASVGRGTCHAFPVPEHPRRPTL